MWGRVVALTPFGKLFRQFARYYPALAKPVGGNNFLSNQICVQTASSNPHKYGGSVLNLPNWLAFDVSRFVALWDNERKSKENGSYKFQKL